MEKLTKVNFTLKNIILFSILNFVFNELPSATNKIKSVTINNQNNKKEYFGSIFVSLDGSPGDYVEALPAIEG